MQLQSCQDFPLLACIPRICPSQYRNNESTRELGDSQELELGDSCRGSETTLPSSFSRRWFISVVGEIDLVRVSVQTRVFLYICTSHVKGSQAHVLHVKPKAQISVKFAAAPVKWSRIIALHIKPESSNELSVSRQCVIPSHIHPGSMSDLENQEPLLHRRLLVVTNVVETPLQSLFSSAWNSSVVVGTRPASKVVLVVMNQLCCSNHWYLRVSIHSHPKLLHYYQDNVQQPHYCLLTICATAPFPLLIMSAAASDYFLACWSRNSVFEHCWTDLISGISVWRRIWNQLDFERVT